MNQFTGQLISQHKRVGIVVAQFNELVTSRLLEGCVSQLALLGIADAAITVVHVPGAMEISREVKLLGDTGQVDGIIALGAVIRGETAHFDYVCQAATTGLAALTLNGPVPVMFGVLTTDNTEQALARAGGKAGNKGAECANGLMQMLTVEAQIAGMSD